jgi:hypothetical protein
MLSLRAFHTFFVALAIVLSAGVGTWTLTHAHQGVGILFLIIGVLLVLYLGYFAAKAERAHLE